MHWRLPLLIALAVVSAGCNAESRAPTEPPSTNVQTALSPPPPPPPPSADEPGISRVNGSTDPPQEGGDYVSFPAAGVKLIRPDGFEDAERFDGFQQPSTLSSVMVVSLPGPFSEVTEGFTAERLKASGMTLHGIEDIEIDGLAGKLLHLTQNAMGADVMKWIVALGDDKETKLITATVPK